MSDPSILDLAALAQIGSARGGRGAKASRDPGLTYLRDLSEDDLPALLAPPPAESCPLPIKALRQTHHTLARLLAEGRKQEEVSAITGFSSSRISILKQDPTFAELIHYYQAQKDQVYLDVHARLAGVGTVALEVLQERLEETPETFTNRELLGVVETTMDRSVAPPKNPKGAVPASLPPVQISVNFVPHQAPAEPRLVEGREEDPQE